MKQLKHVVFIVVALLPLLPVVAYILGNIGNQAGIALKPMGTLEFYQEEDGDWVVTTSADSWGQIMIEPIYGRRGAGGLYGACAGLVDWLDDYAGIEKSVPVLMAVLMLCHVAIVEMFALLIDFLMFVPRKCLELFR